ncbi:MAG: ribonuclease domain-containing protein [Candidatus Nanopelagicales bacterium]
MTGPRSIAALLVVVWLGLTACGAAVEGQSVSPGLSATGSSALDPGASTRYADLAPAEPTSALPTVPVAELPPEAVDTLELIADGGPFPYEQDGSTFGNREGMLPRQPQGFYAEYTVITPGEDDRGARRIVAGDDGSRFYTSDHYSSFREVVSR